jgi:hypothetical protein
MLKKTRKSMTDAERWRYTSTSISDEKLEEPRAMVREDVRATIDEIA